MPRRDCDAAHVSIGTFTGESALEHIRWNTTKSLTCSEGGTAPSYTCGSKQAQAERNAELWHEFTLRVENRDVRLPNSRASALKELG